MATIYFTKLGRFAQVQIDLAEPEKTQQPLYVSASDITVDYNILSNLVTVNINAVRSFTSGDVALENQVYFDNTNSGSFTAVRDKTEFDAAFAVLFPDEGGGSGTTPNLQQVTDVGNSTTNNIQCIEGAGLSEAKIGVLNPIIPFPGERSGYLDLINRNAYQATIVNNLATPLVATQVFFQIPDKSTGSGTETFAMLTDLPLSGVYAGALSGAVNTSLLTRIFTHYTLNENVFRTVIMNFGFFVTSAGNGLVSFELQLPFTIPFSLLAAGTFTAKKFTFTVNGAFLPGYIGNGSTADKVKFEFEETQGATVRQIMGTLIYTSN